MIQISLTKKEEYGCIMSNLLACLITGVLKPCDDVPSNMINKQPKQRRLLELDIELITKSFEISQQKVSSQGQSPAQNKKEVHLVCLGGQNAQPK